MRNGNLVHMILASASMKGVIMKKFLIIGIDPEAVDYSDPNVPVGMTAEKLFADLADTQKQFADQGDHVDICAIQLDGSAEATVTAQLARSTYDCILIGGGIRKRDENLEMFERIINSIRRHAPSTPIGFVNGPQDSPKAAARILSHDYGQTRP